MDWIKVEDKLPKERQRVMYYFKGTGISIGYYTHLKKENGGGYCFFGYDGWLTDDVTHWMPLPEPPQETGVD